MKPRVLLVDDDTTFIADVVHLLGDRFEWQTLTSGETVLSAMREDLPDVVLLDIELGAGPDGLEILSGLRAEMPRTPVIMVTRHDPQRMAAKAWRLGAFGFIEKGSSLEELTAHIERAIEEATLWRENQALRQELAETKGRLVGQSAAMQSIREQIGRVARAQSTVLIQGETGTGKELVAREIHDLSQRAKHLLVPVCCPALPESLVESELFGHEKGSFTGAITRRIGKFELAHRGTIFLDEVSEISSPIQAKLLRVLQERTVERVGGNKEITVDVRVIAASNRNLESLVESGDFRSDLFYRLRVVPLTVPPLRERKEDIPLLTEAILDRKSRQMGQSCPRLSDGAMDAFLAWDWPGNIRELENVLEFALVHSQESELSEELFQGLIGTDTEHLDYAEARGRALARFERNYVLSMLGACEGNVSRAARRMGLSRQGLQKLMKRRGVENRSRSRGRIESRQAEHP
jgi:two-component system nitrogen regulation response regulator NtrX